MRAAIPLAALFLASCDSGLATKKGARVAAEDVADAMTAPLNGRIADLEDLVQRQSQRIDDLESRNHELETEVANLKSSDAHQEDSIDSLFKNDRTFAGRLGMPIEN